MRYALVLGLGVSGRSAAERLLRQGHAVIGVDDKVGADSLKDLISKGMKRVVNDEEIDWSQIFLMVVSPGISPKHRLYQNAIAHGVEVTGEAELSLRGLKQPIVAITGTNGKTTVTLLVEHILNVSGVKAKALGNVGTPLSAYESDPDEVLVVELSSFQLETLSTLSFDAAVLLNITPDHLDRYASMEDYAKSKCHLQSLVKPQAPFFVCSQVVETFGSCLKSGYQLCERESIESFLPLKYRELGKHEWDNAAAAWALCKQFGISQKQFCQGLESFQKPHHRIEFAGSIDGVLFYDDSKGTNIDAVIQAVNAMKGPVILIAGGVDKGASYLLWKEIFQGKVKRIVALGQAAPKIYEELNPYFEMEIVDSLSCAVETAHSHAVRGDHILLSPGCSSYDMFRDYVHRGEEFQRKVQHLRETVEESKP